MDVEEPDALENNLNRASGNIRQALDAMRDVSEEALGYPALDTACADFRETWQTDLKGVEECTGKLTKGLGEVKKNYAELERSLSEEFGWRCSDQRIVPEGWVLDFVR